MPDSRYRQFPIKLIEGLDPNALMLVNPGRDGVEVVTPTNHRFFTWAEVDAMTPSGARKGVSGSNTI